MHANGMPPKLLNLIKTYYLSTHTKVCMYDHEFCFFNIFSGVWQRCAFLSILFNYAIDWIISNALANFHGITVSRDLQISDFDYADNMTILGESFADIQSAIDKIQWYTSKIGMKINVNNTKLLIAGHLLNEKHLVIINM